MTDKIPSAPSRTSTMILLCLGTVAALGCAFGPAWLVRVGLGVALVTAFASVWTTWRQMDRLVSEHLAHVKALEAAAREEMREAKRAHHAEIMSIIERFNSRKAEYRAEIDAARAEIEGLRAGLASANLDNEAKQTRISALNKLVSTLEQELAQVDDEMDDVVLSLPRRGVSRRGLDISGLPLVYPTQEQEGRQA